MLIDLHIHSSLSDGTNTPEEVLQLAELSGVSLLSITDHNSIGAYHRLAGREGACGFSGILIPGVEIASQFQGIFVEILGYMVNPDQIGCFLDKHYSPENMQKKQQLNFLNLRARLLAAGFKMDPDLEYCTPWANLAFQKELWKYPENMSLLPPEVAKHPELLGKLTYDPASPFYVPTNYPPAEEVVAAIHQAGGLAFLAHPCIYPVADYCRLIADMSREIPINGIEVFHSLHSQKQIKQLLRLAEERKLYISGGSDYHGTNKPKIKMAVGLGDLQVPPDFIAAWLFM